MQRQRVLLAGLGCCTKLLLLLLAGVVGVRCEVGRGQRRGSRCLGYFCCGRCLAGVGEGPAAANASHLLRRLAP